MLRITDYLKTYIQEAVSVLSWRIAWVLCLMLGIGLTEWIGLMLLVPLLQLAGLPIEAGPVNRITELIAQTFGRFNLPLSLPAVLVVYVILVVGRAYLARYSALTGVRLKQFYVTQLREKLYRNLLQSNWLFFVRSRSSDFMHILTQELDAAGAGIIILITWFIKCVMALTYLGVAYFISPKMTGLVLLSGTLLLLPLWFKSRLLRQRSKTVSKTYEALFAAVSDQIAGMKVAKSHGVEARFAEGFLHRAVGVEKAHVETRRIETLFSFLFQAGTTLLLVAIVYVALTVLELGTAQLLILLYIFSRLMPQFSGLLSSYQNFITTLPPYEHVKDLEARCLAAAEVQSSGSERLPLERSLEFENVGFGYTPDLPILQGLELSVVAGRTTALVGTSGAGKSTVVDLAIGLLSPQTGRVTVDGQVLEGERAQAWRRGIGYVAQDVFMSHGSIRDNLTLTCQNASDAAIYAALDAAAASFVRNLPEGLGTVLGDRGVRLSGGERQRLSLARALLRKPTLLVLDEATSSLDAENERRIQRAIDDLGGSMTILVVAHRLATIRKADCIYVMADGKVLESGRWEDLIARPDSQLRALAHAQGLSPVTETS